MSDKRRPSSTHQKIVDDVGERLGSVVGALQMLVDDSFLVVLGHGELEKVDWKTRVSYS